MMSNIPSFEDIRKYLTEMFFLSNGVVMAACYMQEDAIEIYGDKEELNLTHIRVKDVEYPITMGPHLISVYYPINNNPMVRRNNNLNPMEFYEYIDEDVAISLIKGRN